MKWCAWTVTLLLFLVIGCGSEKVNPEKLKQANALIEQGEYEQGIEQLEALAKTSPEDEALKLSLISAHMKYAWYFMDNDTIPPRVKYPNALKHYRAVLKLDPNNKNAQDNANQIIEIYKMMGREVPEV